MKLRIDNYSKHINPFWMMVFACCVNLCLMHYYILQNCQFDVMIEATSIIDNAMGVCFDIVTLFICLKLITRNDKFSLCILFILTWLWSFSNIIYSRFFHHYLSLSAIGQGGSLVDGIVIRSITEKIYFEDFLYFMFFMIVLFLVKKANIRGTNYFKSLMSGLLILIVLDLAGHILYCVSAPQSRYVQYYIHRIYSKHIETSACNSLPINANFTRGSIRSIGAEVYADLQGSMEISDEKMITINNTIDMALKKRCHVSNVNKQRNVIFILVESLMSLPIDMKVNNRDVTPFLNSLKRDSLVYYNGKMKTNITIGESSDGQFIYMTGILPLRSMVTVSKAKRISLPGLPKMLGVDSRMIIPTVSSMWNQDEMCQQYGFKNLFTSNDYERGKYGSLTDEQVFDLAIQKDQTASQPFFSVVLTISMHQPYKKQIDPSFPIMDSTITNELANYLNVCHYTDRQIENYFAFLKESGLYKNSIIVIAADHPIDIAGLNGISKNIPLFIINPDVPPKNMWQGECNQLDVYTTLLDLLGRKSRWSGLGHSLVSPSYEESVSPEKWDVSEWIIMGNYFSQETYQ